MTGAEGTLRMANSENMLLRLDEGAIGALYRVAIGFATIPAHDLLVGHGVGEWTIIPFLLAVLFLLRLALSIVRAVIPFPADLLEIWSVRRRMAKYYDSYQWRKLTWVGIGLGAYLLNAGQYRPVPFALALFCLFSGLLGTLIWRKVAADSQYPKPTIRKKKSAK